MGINFNDIWIVFLILPAIAFIIWSYRASKRRGKKEKWITALRCVVIVLILLSLAGLNIRKYSDRTTVIFAVDLSESTKGIRNEMESFIKEALENKPIKYDVGIITFGKNSLVEHALAENIYFSGFESIPMPHFTNIDEGLKMAAILMPEDTRKRVVLLTDGNQNLGDGIERAKLLFRQGIEVDGVFFETQPKKDVQITSLEVPSNLYEGESYDIYVTIDSTYSTSGILRLYANREIIKEQKVEIQKGENRFIFKDTAYEGGIKTYEAEIETFQDDIRQNNRMASYINVKGKPVIALVEGEEGEGRELKKILDSSNVEVKLFTPRSLPDSLEELRKYHGIVLCDVAAYDLKEEKIELLDSYVKNLGRGMLIAGGDNSYALGGYMGTLLEDMLPVDLDLMKKADIPSLGLVLVIDRSGSMSMEQYGISKMDMAKEAAVRSMESLRPNDYIGVIAFSGAASWVVEPQKPENIDSIKQEILSITSGGGTNIYPGLEMAYNSLKQLDTKLKHIILLTDGQSQSGDFEGIVKKMKEAGITLSTVAVGSDSDQVLLNRLAELGEGRYYYTDEFTDIPSIFTKETYMATQSYIQNRTFFPIITGYSPAIAEFTEGFPPLHGYIATLPKNTAEISLSSDKMDPILAEWQYGLGRVVAWTSDLRGIWTENWIKWEKSQDFWLNVISRILPAEDESQGIIQAGYVGDTGIVEVILAQNIDETLESKAVVIDPDGEKQEIDMNVVEPGKYRGNFDISDYGVYLIRVEQRKKGQIVNTLDTGLSVSYSSEYDIRQSDYRHTLERIVNQAGGEILDSPTRVFRSNQKPVWTQTEMWPYLLVLALILFVIDIAIRKLKIKFPEIKIIRDKLSKYEVSQEVVSGDSIKSNENKQKQVSEQKINRRKENKFVKGKAKQKEQEEEVSTLSSQLLNARKSSKRKKL